MCRLTTTLGEQTAPSALCDFRLPCVCVRILYRAQSAEREKVANELDGSYIGKYIYENGLGAADASTNFDM